MRIYVLAIDNGDTEPEIHAFDESARDAAVAYASLRGLSYGDLQVVCLLGEEQALRLIRSETN